MQLNIGLLYWQHTNDIGRISGRNGAVVGCRTGGSWRINRDRAGRGRRRVEPARENPGPVQGWMWDTHPHNGECWARARASFYPPKPPSQLPKLLVPPHSSVLCTILENSIQARNNPSSVRAAGTPLWPTDVTYHPLPCSIFSLFSSNLCLSPFQGWPLILLFLSLLFFLLLFQINW